MSSQDIAQRIRDTKRVRYIKLGQGGSEFQDCIDNNRLYLGYWSGNTNVFNAIIDAKANNDWEAIKQPLFAEMETEGEKSKTFKTRAFNCIKEFFSGDQDTLWITFHNRRLYWCFMAPNGFTNSVLDDSGNPKTHAATIDGWHDMSIDNSQVLYVNELAGILTKTAGTQQTLAKIEKVPAQYLKNKLLSIPDPDIKMVKVANETLIEKIGPLVERLRPNDFEVLVDLIFTRSGWRREGELGRTQNTVDLELFLPTTQERAFVQVKSNSSWEEFCGSYLTLFLENSGGWDRMFWAQHQNNPKEFLDKIAEATECGFLTWKPKGSKTSEKFHINANHKHRLQSVTIMDLEHISRSVLDAGLLDWLMKRVG